MHPCAVERLDAIRTAVEGNKSRREITALIDSYWAPYFSYDSIARDAANTSDVASHMPADTLDLYAIVYTQMPPMTRNVWSRECPSHNERVTMTLHLEDTARERWEVPPPIG